MLKTAATMTRRSGSPSWWVRIEWGNQIEWRGPFHFQWIARVTAWANDDAVKMVYNDNEGWWFWTEPCIERRGPFKDEQEARAKSEAYSAKLLVQIVVGVVVIIALSVLLARHRGLL